MERPLPADVARPARAYLAALVPPDELSDAWHELVDDVAYWGDRDLLAVLRLAHQVVLQHERVAPEVAALALVESGVEDPADVAVVLGADEGTARDWTHVAIAARDGDDAASTGRFSDGADPEPTTAPTITEATPPGAPRPTPREGGALRIGFEDDGPLPSYDEHAGPRWATRRILVAALVLWVLVIAVWLLLG